MSCQVDARDVGRGEHRERRLGVEGHLQRVGRLPIARVCPKLGLLQVGLERADAVAQLGGIEVDEFVARVAADKRINAFFGATASDPKRLAMFKMNLVNQICQASGGPCKYTGKDMKSAHMGMGVSGADFNALVEDLVGALDKFKVGQHEKDQLLGALGPMKTDIVEKP